jgi:cytochrome c-type biogenesis protein CcmE
MTKQQKRLAFLAGVFAATALAVGLVLSALNTAVAYFYTPSELAALPESPKGVIRLGGLVEAGSLQHAENEAEVEFVVTDQTMSKVVRYKGVLPDLFREGQGVIVEGRLAEDGTLAAMQVLAKHDENYMPREVEKALKEQGHWKDQYGK